MDLKRELHALYSARRTPALVEVPDLSYLMVDGEGRPNTSPGWTAAIEALYATAYAAKYAVRRSGGLDFTVMPLEGLWWARDVEAFKSNDYDAWRWTLMIMQPPVVGPDIVEAAKSTAVTKAPCAGDVRLEALAEGTAAQVLHVGPYSEERPTVELMHAFIADSGYLPRGAHHEIYLGDPRRAAPERLRTILRQPVTPARLTP